MSGLFILNVGSGDTKISFDKTKPEEVERARRIVQDMLNRGYAILVQAGEKDGRPLYFRATAFDPTTDEYIVAGMPDSDIIDAPPNDENQESGKPEKQKKGRKGKRVKAEGTKAVAVARSAGGMSTAADSIEMENMRKLDAFAPLRKGLAMVAEGKGEWAGIPMPLSRHPLVIEPTYPNALELMQITKEAEPKTDEPEIRIRNRFYSHKYRSDIYIFEKAGKVWCEHDPAFHSLKQQIATMDASDAWGIEQEAAALQLLAQLLPHFAYKRYLMTGAIIERSARSGVYYLFRKLRPTVAFSFNPTYPDGSMDGRILAALCMHPIAYYEASWAGAMCPTDDVIAHLMLMRGDEHMFWKRCNHHHPVRPEAGL